MSNRTRRVLIASAVFIGLVVILLAVSDDGIEVETTRIVRDTLREVVTEEGRTRVQDRYTVTAPVTGRLARILLEEGDSLARGTTIAHIYPMPEDPRTVSVARARLQAAEARRREAAARVEEVLARVEQLDREAERRLTLVQDSILSREEAERYVLAANSGHRQLEAARAMLRAAEAEAEAARAALIGASPRHPTRDAVPVIAPVAGRVLRVLEENERVVPAGTPLLDIGNTGRLELLVDVLSEDAVRIEPGAPVLIDDWGGDPIEGCVRTVEPDAFTKISALGVEEQRVNIIVELFDPPPSLGSGYRAETHIVTWTGAGVLTVPTSALFQEDGSWRVFVAQDDRAVQRAVRIGHRTPEAAEVVDGLQEDEEVILFPSAQINDGSKILRRE